MDEVTEKDDAGLPYGCSHLGYYNQGSSAMGMMVIGNTIYDNSTIQRCADNQVCVCLGYEDDITCGGAGWESDTKLNELGGNPTSLGSPESDDCPISEADDWDYWLHYCRFGDGDATECCSCFPEGAISRCCSKQTGIACQDTSGGAVSDLQAAYNL
jgi:hypothetical protein